MLQPIAFPGNRHDVRMVQQPVEQGRGQRRILREGRVPLPERQVAGHDQAAAFIQGCDHLEEQVCLFPVHRQVTYLVDDQEPICLDRAVHHRLQIVLGMRRRQRQHQVGRSREARLDAGLRRLVTQCHRQGHCCKVSDEAAFCLIQRPYISKTLLTRRISPRGSP